MRWKASLPAVALSGWLLAQSHVATERLALPVLSFGLVVAVLCDSVDFRRRWSAVEAATLAFCAAWLSCALAGLDPSRSLQLSVVLLPLAPAVIVLGRTGGSLQPGLLAASLLLVGTLQAALVVGAAFGGDRSPQGLVDGSGASWLAVPNDLAWVACLWPLWLDAASDHRRRALVGAAILVQAVAFVLLQSRLGLLLGGMSIGLYVLGRQGLLCLGNVRPRHLRAGPALGLVGLCGALVALLVVKGTGSLGARTQLWGSAWQVFAEHPLLGVGPNNFVLAYAAHMPAAAIDPRLTPWPHNLPLELLAEGGTLLFSAGALLVACAARSACRRDAMRIDVALPVLVLLLVEASTLRGWFWALAIVWLASVNRTDDRLRGTGQ